MKSRKIAALTGICFLIVTSAKASFSVIFNDTISLQDGVAREINLEQLDLTDNTKWYYNPGHSLGAINITYQFTFTGVQVELDNDESIAQSGTAQFINDVTFSGEEWNLGNPDDNTLVAGNLGTNQTQVFNLAATQGDNTSTFTPSDPGNDGRATQGDYANWVPGNIVTGNTRSVDSSFWAAYQGTGTTDWITTSDWLTGATFDGSNGRFNGSTPTGTFFMQVEYIIVPEPGPLALAGIALGSAGFLALLRRRKRA